MQNKNWIDWVALAIAAITILSGVGQILASNRVLMTMNLAPTPATIYLFMVVSLLTALFGAALLHSILSVTGQGVVVLWASVQKILGAGAVLMAVLQGLIAGSALIAAGYDFAAGVFLLWYWLRTKSV